MNKPKLPSNRNFGIVFFVVFFLIGMWPILKGGDVRIWSILLSFFFLLLGLFNSKILTPLNKLWFKFGRLLGIFISPIIMGIIYFFVVTPTSLILKISGKDILNLKKNKDKTYWIDKKKYETNMKNQF